MLCHIPFFKPFSLERSCNVQPKLTSILFLPLTSTFCHWFLPSLHRFQVEFCLVNLEYSYLFGSRVSTVLTFQSYITSPGLEMVSAKCRHCRRHCHRRCYCHCHFRTSLGLGFLLKLQDHNSWIKKHTATEVTIAKLWMLIEFLAILIVVF